MDGAVLELFEACSNGDRWGASDGLGTLSLIAAERRGDRIERRPGAPGRGPAAARATSAAPSADAA